MTRREELYDIAKSLYEGDWRTEDAEELAATLADWRKKAKERGDEIDETYTVDEEAKIICGYIRELVEAEKPAIWYAVQSDDDDNDWGTGSENYAEAVEMLKQYPAGRIAVIDNGDDPICLREIKYSEVFHD